MTEPSLDAAHLRRWIGSSAEAVDTITPGLVDRFRATFDLPATSSAEGPPGVHWCLAPPIASTAGLGIDGHPAKGVGLLPPVPLPRRMWAGGEVEFCRPLRVGDEVRRASTVADVAVKQGRAGPLCFVVVRHTYAVRDETALVERQDIVYRGADQGRAPPPERGGEAQAAPFTRRLTPTPVLLFRYSALTFNGHRIHYDRRYSQEQEGYPALVVHGPLQASLLLQFAVSLRDGAWPTRFAFRSSAPAFDDDDLTLNAAPREGGGLTLWTATPGGPAAMTAEVEWRPAEHQGTG